MTAALKTEHPHTETETEMATLRYAGIEIRAPLQLLLLAGWSVSDGRLVDRSNNGWVARRLMRACNESGIVPMGRVADSVGRQLIARCIELGEIEALEGRRDNTRLQVAKLEAEAAHSHRMAAELELEAAQLRSKSSGG